MKRSLFFRRMQRWILAGALAPAFLAGCHSTPNRTRFNKCADVVPGAQPMQNGHFVRQHELVQANKAEMDDFVVYLHEWYMGGRDLGPYGEYHIAQMAQRMGFTPFPVLVEVSPDPALNEHRRRVVIEKLTNAGATDAHVRVQLGRPEAEGLHGAEAFRVYQGIIFGGQGGQGGGGGAGGGFGGGGGGIGGGGFGGFLGGFPGY